MKRLLKAFILIMIFQSSLSAQVRLFLDYSAKTKTYTVSMMPERTWTTPNNLTATGQITLKATTKQFFIKDIKNYVEGAEWVPSGRIDAPIESPNYDYVFFSLKTKGGLTEMPYQAFKPTKLFSFTLSSNCAKELMLVDNREDPFAPPNSRNVNIGNSLGAIGANGEAYAGNISNLPIFCPYAITPETPTPENGNNKNTLLSEDDATIFFEQKTLYPTPTTQVLNVKMNWKGEMGDKDILVYNNIGEMVYFFSKNLQKGKNEFSLDLEELENGLYNFIIVDGNYSIPLGKTIKIQ
jgi:hypothetical protein